MYIDSEELNLTRSDSASENGLLSPETSYWESPTDSTPGTAPSSPETPSWGPPADNTPGSAPSSPASSSPETPSWGPPTDSTPGSAPLSPETPPWGPPIGNAPGSAPSSPETPPWGPPAGNIPGTVLSPFIFLPVRPTFPSRPNRGTASIRFLHAAANQRAINIRLGNRNVINDMRFGSFTPYYTNTGNQSTPITVINTRTGDTLYRGNFYFSNQSAYTVSIVDNGSRITLYVLQDTPCNNTNAGCIRAVNLSPNSGAVDIFLSGYGRIFQRINQFSYTGFRLINQGTYRAAVSESLPCTNNNSIIMTEDYVECNNTRIAIMDTATFNVQNGVTYTLYIIGLAYQFPSLRILPLESDLIY